GSPEAAGTLVPAVPHAIHDNPHKSNAGSDSAALPRPHHAYCSRPGLDAPPSASHTPKIHSEPPGTHSIPRYGTPCNPAHSLPATVATVPPTHAGCGTIRTRSARSSNILPPTGGSSSCSAPARECPCSTRQCDSLAPTPPDSDHDTPGTSARSSYRAPGSLSLPCLSPAREHYGNSCTRYFRSPASLLRLGPPFFLATPTSKPGPENPSAAAPG